jgi:hypothetical protein
MTSRRSCFCRTHYWDCYNSGGAVDSIGFLYSYNFGVH